MTTVEVLAPVRLETRFIAPEDREDGVDQWLLRLRIYPDEFSIRRTVPPPAPAELDRLSEALAAMSADPPLPEPDAFASFATSVGAARALLLWRTHVMDDGAGGMTVDRSDEAAPTQYAVHCPAGLPERMEVWLTQTDGSRVLGAELTLDLAAIGADLDLVQFGDQARLAGALPETWWLSYPRAVDVGLAVDIDVGANPPDLDALVVVGIGETEPADLIDAHNAGGRMAILAPGTPTNTVAGEPTTDFGVDADSLYPLLHVDPNDVAANRDVLAALTGQNVAASGVPMLGGEVDLSGPGWAVVQGLWPLLWGRALRDVTLAGALEIDIAAWAANNLMVQGPHPAIRVGEQPYGLLPTSSFVAWIDEPGDAEAELESRIRSWAIVWRTGAAATARSANAWVHGADTPGLLEVLGLHAPSRHWRVRPIADLNAIQTTRALAGLPPMPATDWDRSTAWAWTDVPYPGRPIGPAARTGPVPGPPNDMPDDADRLRELCRMHPEPLYFGRHDEFGLLGHLYREALIAGRAVIGEAINRWHAGDPVELGQALPLDNESSYVDYVMQGDDNAVEELANATDENGRILAEHFARSQAALEEVASLWEWDPEQVFNTVLAALDTAAFRVDPWLTGIADRRLQHLINDGAPFRLGAYGWVDAPGPYSGPDGGVLAPGPTTAGMLHAPSHAQALTAALLRDAAVRYPGDDRWQLTIDSAKVRASIALAERVRLGVHPYEALGLEVEKLAGDWETVRTLRAEYALTDEQGERRVCDGARVLRAAREGTLVAGLPADLPSRLAPLDEVLDTYSDLLVADGIHALVTGRADLANAAMEAAAGLGAPADLRAIRTPRAASTVRVAAWALLAPGEPEPAGASPAQVADPAFAALVTAEVGPTALDAEDPTLAAERERLAMVLGGGEDDQPVPSLTGGMYEGLGATADAALRSAMTTDLTSRLQRLRDLADTERDELMALDPTEPDAAATITALAHRWRIDLSGVVPEDPVAVEPTAAELQTALLAALADRIAAADVALAIGAPAPTAETVNALCRSMRDLAGRRELPVLPIVDRSLLPVLRAGPDLDQTWLELVAAVHPRLGPLEARQFDPTRPPWPAALAAPDGATDPWHHAGPVLVVYGPAVSGTAADAGRVAITALDGWTDSIPSRRHATTAAFGFNAPKSRAPQAVLLAVPPDRSERLTTTGLVDVILETRELAHARATWPTDRAGLPYATPAPLVHAVEPVSFVEGWPA